MKPGRKKEDDSVRGFLEQLAADKGTIITDEEYADVRSSRLRDLANPPRIERAVAGLGIAVALIGITLWVIALMAWDKAPNETTRDRLALGLISIGLGAFLFFGNLWTCRKETRRSTQERQAEIDDLLQAGLITTQEHETIRQAIARPNK